MTAQGLTTKLVSAALILQILHTTVKAQDVTTASELNQPSPPIWNVTSSVVDYIIQHKLKNAANILNYDQQIDAHKTNYHGQVDTLDIQRKLIESKLQEVNEKLYPLESLSLLTKHCVQSYRWKIPFSAAVKTNFINLISSTKSYLNSYISQALNTRNILNNYYNNQLQASLNDCQKKHNESQYNCTVCVAQVINASNIYTINNRKTFSSHLQTAENNAKTRTKTAMEDGYNQIYGTSVIIEETLTSIDNCINDLLPYTEGAQNSTSIASICPNVLNLSLKEVDFSSATIKNPFYGFSSQTPCLQVNFVLSE